MGNRLHIHTKHEIEYGSESFNWQMNGLYELLNDAGCEICGQLNDDAVGDWEIDEEQFIEAIKQIRKMSSDNIATYFDRDYVRDDLDEFKKEVIADLQRFADTGDHHDGFYHFSWF